jgi:hypothetical protein
MLLQHGVMAAPIPPVGHRQRLPQFQAVAVIDS